MSLPGQKTAASFLEWEKFTSLLLKLERDKEYKFQLLIATGTFTGLRISDLLTLTWEMILEKDELVIQEKKTKKVREIKIVKDLKETISRLHIKMKIRENSELMFVNRFGKKAMNTQWINTKLKKLFKHYNIDTRNVSTHMFRKTLGREIWRRNNYSEESLIKLGMLFSHASVSTTKIYLSIQREEIDDLYDCLTL